jgi:hypothetical protein
MMINKTHSYQMKCRLDIFQLSIIMRNLTVRTTDSLVLTAPVQEDKLSALMNRTQNKIINTVFMTMKSQSECRCIHW